jgi:hypothetical protein
LSAKALSDLDVLEGVPSADDEAAAAANRQPLRPQLLQVAALNFTQN